MARYRLTVRPWLSLLAMRINCRMHQGKTALRIAAVRQTSLDPTRLARHPLR